MTQIPLTQTRRRVDTFRSNRHFCCVPRWLSLDRFVSERTFVSRYKKLDPDLLLDAAESVIINEGAHAISIGTVAAAAGVTKGGIQSNFGTREKLIEALFNRWGIALDDRIEQIRKTMPEDADPLDIFLEANWQHHLENPKQDAAMMYLLTQSSEQREAAREWISDKLEKLSLGKEDGKRRRLRFIVFQALIVMKSMELAPFSKTEWQEIFSEINDLLGDQKT